MEIRESELIEMRVPCRMLLSCNLTAEQKLLYIIIYNFRDGKGEFDLAKDLKKNIMRLPTGKINDHIKELERLGYIELVYHNKENPSIKLAEY